MAASSVLAFWAVALLLIVVPGADWAFTISAGLRRRSVYPAVSGLVVGYAAITLIVAGGVGALVAGNPAILTGLTLVGGLYLIWHGTTTFAHPAEPATPADGLTGTDWNTFLRGIGVSGLNPKGLLIFLALLPQFTDPRGPWPIAAQISVLGLAFMTTIGLFYLGIGRLTHTVLYGRPAAARLISRLSGAAMIGIGAWLLIDHLLN
ncbi:LysE family transporter [Acrocarpospora macrocephala]|uniref:Lysine transporter LysE n=1 Tax=Acrocarpospora macrocephala TaxID=150177 RepID=A0A5M3X0G6_9ACTN|nr:LysE family translocator [Acrocarpospora macrocephala]GES13619.1 lysine transporter LysE [Acrocarpospora macrocephala]